MKQPVKINLRCSNGDTIPVVLIDDDCKDVKFGKDWDPENIRSGLLCCALNRVASCNCPYGDNCNECENMQKLKLDALSYIEELEVECGIRTRIQQPQDSRKYYFVDGLPHCLDFGTGCIVNMGLYEDPKYVAEIDRMAWGWVLMDGPLTVDVMNRYGMISAPVE